MSSFEWMELQTLTSDINAARTRLATARANKDNRVARVLEQEITAAEKRRDRLVAHITTHLADVPEGAQQPEAIEGADLSRIPAAQESPDRGEGEQPPAEFVDPIVGSGAPVPTPAPKADSVEGGINVWDQLTPSDIERAKKELGARRAEMLARHAEELKTLDADHAQLAGLEQAIDAFLRRFSPSSAEAAVVVLGEERETRLQSRA